MIIQQRVVGIAYSSREDPCLGSPQWGPLVQLRSTKCTSEEAVPASVR